MGLKTLVISDAPLKKSIKWHLIWASTSYLNFCQISNMQHFRRQQTLCIPTVPHSWITTFVSRKWMFFHVHCLPSHSYFGEVLIMSKTCLLFCDDVPLHIKDKDIIKGWRTKMMCAGPHLWEKTPAFVNTNETAALFLCRRIIW